MTGFWISTYVLGDPDRAHHEGRHVVAHALLAGAVRLLLRLGLRLVLLRGGGGVIVHFPLAGMGMLRLFVAALVAVPAVMGVLRRGMFRRVAWLPARTVGVLVPS
jgi:hypothetical protein